MQARIVLNVKQMTKEDITELIRAVRDWELRTPKASIVGVRCDTLPKMEAAEEREVFLPYFPDIDRLVGTSEPEPGFLALGARGVVVDGKLIGTCDELSLSFGSVGLEEVTALENAETIGLVRIHQE